MFTDIYELMLFSVRFTIQISYQNYLKIMLEFFQNLFKIFQKSLQNGVPEFFQVAPAAGGGAV